MRTAGSWVEADLHGLAKLVNHRSKAFVIYELLANALDEATTRVDITLEKVPGRPFARVVVSDNNPAGFTNLAHAYTLFAESDKKTSAEQRGRFNMGEKVVLALCREARIVTTSGTVEFSADGRRREHRRQRTACGSRFEALVRMTLPEYERCLIESGWVLVPEGVHVYLNGTFIEPRTPLCRFETVLPTVLSDAEGTLRPTRRKTVVEVYEPAAGERAMIYEMGIPVVETGDRYHVNVRQKVPLNMDRDNVPPAFLQTVRTFVLNHTAQLLIGDETTQAWVDAAFRDERIAPEAITDLITSRYGTKVVTADPSDPEANSRATAEGYVVLAGRMLDAAQWKNVRRVELAPRAGRVFPTGRPYSTAPGASPVRVVPPADWSVGMHEVVLLTQRLGIRLMNVAIDVRIVHTTNNFAACYGNRQLDFNLLRLGHSFFDEWQTHLARVLDLLLDEFGHEYEANHLSAGYYRALRRLGAEMTVLALKEPQTFQMAEAHS
jgi:hypothetical protein